MLKETIKKLLDWISDKGNRILIWLLGQKPACVSDGSIHCDRALFLNPRTDLKIRGYYGKSLLIN